MNTITLAAPSPVPPRRTPKPFDIGPRLRLFILTFVTILLVLIPYAFARHALGQGPSLKRLHDPFVLVHLASVVPAIPLGAWLLLTRKTGPAHRLLGKIWLVLMIVAATAAIFIRYQNNGHFGWNHLFVVLTLASAPRIYLTARRHNWRAHRRHVISMYVGAGIIAGFTSFLPGRAMWAMAFG